MTMKNIFGLLKISVLLIMTTISCVRNTGDEPVPPAQEIFTYTAVAPSVSTKASFENGDLFWEAGDRILIHNGNTSYEFFTKVTQKSHKADFVYEGKDFSAKGNILAFYPYDLNGNGSVDSGKIRIGIPSRQNAVAGGYDSDAVVAAAVASGKNLDFHYLSSFVRFTVSDDDITSVSFSGNSGESVAGLFVFSANGDGKYDASSGTDVSSEVVLSPADGSFFVKGQTYYLAVAPAQLENGFTITMHKGAEESITKRYDSAYTLHAAQILDPDNVTLSWDSSLADSSEDVPTEADADGWIGLSRPEHLMALLLYGAEDGAKYRITKDLDMGVVPSHISDMVKDEIVFKDVTVDGTEDGIYSPSSYSISNLVLPNARGIFSSVENFSISNIDVRNVSVGNPDNLEALSGTGVLIGSSSGELYVNNVKIHDSNVVAPCKVGSLVGAIYDGSALINDTGVHSGSVSTVWVEGVSGQCGAFVGYIGRSDEGPDADRSVAVDARFTGCISNETEVKAQISRIERPAGIFIGAVNGYDYQERVSIEYCNSSATLEITEGLTDFESRYSNSHRSEFVEPLMTEGLIGGSAYCRETAVFYGKPFVPAWDGTRTVTPLTAVAEFDGRDGGIALYSAEDVASLQGQHIASGNHYLLADIDLGGDQGVVFEPIGSIFHLDGLKKEFIETDTLTMECNNTIYNCKVVLESHDGVGAAFIKGVSQEGTLHCNVNMVGSDISNHHDESIPEPGEFEADNGAGNAYAGTFVSRAWAPYTITNVHVAGGRVHGLCKIGGLVGMVGHRLYMKDCSVNDCLVDNYEANIKNYYMMQTSFSSFVVYVNEWWYTQGECGGLIGFLFSPDAQIIGCSVADSRIDCYGQPNKEVIAGVYSSGFTPQNPTSRIASGKTLVAGRHVNQFIGDVRTSKSTDTVLIKDYHVSGNTYFDVPAETESVSSVLDNSLRHHYMTDSQGMHHYCNCVGQAYYVGVDVVINIIITQLKKHVAEYAGTLTFNAVGEEPVTITEPEGMGNDVAWTGGDFYIAGLGY